MKITLFFINWNDKFYLPFIKRHYSKFCQRIVMYDNHSTDGSRELAVQLGFEVRVFGIEGMLDDQQYLYIKNDCWKEERQSGQRADYVIVCDADEFISIAPQCLTGELPLGDAPLVQGFNMISNGLPVDDIFEINTGAPSANYSKQAIFSPRQIEEIKFVHGCHQNYMVGVGFRSPTRTGLCTLHHFRQIGGLVRMLDRHAIYRTRLSKFNLKHGMGSHYGRPEWNTEEIAAFNESKRVEWEQLTSEAKQLW